MRRARGMPSSWFVICSAPKRAWEQRPSPGARGAARTIRPQRPSLSRRSVSTGRWRREQTT
eukprot:4268633-Alexandrium_andersonii.AAC.1